MSAVNRGATVAKAALAARVVKTTKRQRMNPVSETPPGPNREQQFVKKLP